MVDAYLFFYDKIAAYFLGTESEKPLGSDLDLPSRLDKCFQALKNALHVVVIDLDEDDDAQVIFETLNARGEPLLGGWRLFISASTSFLTLSGSDVYGRPMNSALTMSAGISHSFFTPSHFVRLSMYVWPCSPQTYGSSLLPLPALWL